MFTAAATVIGLSVLEGLARLAEPALSGATARTALPVPGDLDCMPECIPGLASYPEQPQAPGIAMVYDERRQWWIAKPDDDSMEFNRMGMRGPDLPDPPPPGERRLLALGDSTVWGHGVAWQDIFTVRAAELVAEQSGQAVRPVIGAQPGMDVGQSLQVLGTLGADIDPDWVLIANLWSDLFHADRPTDLQVQPPSPFALYRVAVLALGPWLKPRVVSWLDFERGVGMPAPGREPRTALPLYMESLLALAEGSRALGAAPVFVVLPAPIDLDPAGAPAFVREYREGMRTIAARAQAPLVDGPACLRARRATNAAFYDQVHPSPAGHQLLAECVADTLLRTPTGAGGP